MFDTNTNMLRVYGYTQGCPACDELKTLLTRHNISFTFIPVGRKGSDCVHRKWVVSQGHDTVPQVWMDQTYIGNYGTLKHHLEPKESELNAQSLLGWIPATPAKVSEEPFRSTTGQAVAQKASSNGPSEEVPTKMRAAQREPDDSFGAEACFINPMTGQRECG